MRARSIAVLAVACALAACVAGCASGGAGRGTTAAETTGPAAADPGEEANAMRLTSSAFQQGGAMPDAHAYGGRNASPPLEWSGAPEGTRSLAVACVDLHPVANGWVHWLVIDIPAGVSSLAEGASPSAMPAGSRELPTTWGAAGWGGPQPPRGSGSHTYEFTVFALDVDRLEVPDRAEYGAVRSAMAGHVLGTATLSGTYER